MNYGKSLPQLKLLVTLICGIVVGFSISQFLQNSSCSLNVSLSSRVGEFRKFLSYNTEINAEHKREHQLGSSEPLTEFQPTLKNTSNSIPNQLYNEVRVLCWVLTGPENHAKRAIHVKKTWGKRCNKILFMSSTNDTELGTIKLPVKEGRGQLWKKTREAFKYIYENHLDEAEWFLKADDDTYVIVENLRVFLYQFSSEAPVYFGCKFKPHVRQGYMSGGAGYVLSKEALRRFAERAYSDSRICRQSMGGSEDKEMGFCLQNVGVVAGDSRDEMKRGRFFPKSPYNFFMPKNTKNWYWRYVYYNTDNDSNCCSDSAISFHYIKSYDFYVLDYFIYKLNAFGASYHNLTLPQKRNMTELLIKWQNETSDNPL